MLKLIKQKHSEKNTLSGPEACKILKPCHLAVIAKILVDFSMWYARKVPPEFL